MRGCEIKALRWYDVDLLADTITIRKCKTAAAARVIPLTSDAFEVFVQLRKRAELFGAVEPSHFIFASFKPVVVFENQKPVGSRITGFNPTVPIGSWKKAWGKLTAKAGLSGLRFNDLRHHCITELLTSPNVSVQTTKNIAGHFSQR
jgi:integrase